MLRLRVLCMSLFVVWAVWLSAVSFAASPEEDAKAAYAAWDEAFNKADAKALAAFYSDNALILPSTHNLISGPAEIEKFFVGILGMGAKGHKFEVIQAGGEGNLVYAAAKWSATGKDANGADQQWGGTATSIFERQGDGSLKIKLHTFN